MTVWINLGGRAYKVVLPVEGTEDLPKVDGIAIPVDVRGLDAGVLSILLTSPEGMTRSFRCVEDDDAVLVEGVRFPYKVSDPRSLRTRSAAEGETGPQPVKCPMPGRIVRILVSTGDTVTAGQGCVVIEAMKMQNELKALRSGTVSSVSATIGETVAAGATLLVIG